MGIKQIPSKKPEAGNAAGDFIRTNFQQSVLTMFSSIELAF